MSLYRKYRPQKFESLIGQNHVRQTLSNALSSGNFSHAYIFSGPKGSGKTTTARLLAKALNCTGRELSLGSFEPCNKCRSCKEITAGHSMDMIEIDAASNRGIDEIRDLREKIKFAPTASKYKIYIIDECHMLTKEAFNALLKTLEEPPAHAIFIMATTEAHKVPPTILSRAQVFDFKKANLQDILKLLNKVVAEESIKIDDEALHLIGRLSFGAFRDALSMLEQVASIREDARHKITLEQVQEILGQTTASEVWDFVESLANSDRKKALKLVEKIYFEGKDLENFLAESISILRKLILIKAELSSEFEAGGEEEQRLKEISEYLTTEKIVLMIEKFVEASTKVKTSILGQLPLEMAVFELTEGQQIQNAKFKMQNDNVKIKNSDEGHGVALSEVPASGARRSRAIASGGGAEDKGLAWEAESEKHPVAGFNQQHWPSVFKEVKAHNNSLAAMLRDAQFAGTTDSQITLAVKFKFHAEQICSKRNLTVIESAIMKVCGSPYKVECVVDPELKIKKPLEQEEEVLNNAKEVFEVEE
ncbi:DNA polymerase III, subunit gamma and tau [Candidatus Berkelbacteria bacterium RBG_13_40_8]|uniref:DNA polymerase III subunit gamma/tau n=1 Tax=Candidatus Berkelbacteria bacterium RBG_13_40_8 TaxID=1797467 RepID=A0A1F5DQ44_9BACT|nr:MAG: DNA polymerase III, subunit gamma and tau [Candidatus Berkelbacteria bacterium RBG_13_40_8]